MATSSILGGAQLPAATRGKGTDALGPSDNSDSGSDAQGAYGEGEMDSDSDAAGTGERASVEGMDHANQDILPDHLVSDPDAAPVEELGAQSEDVEALASDDEIEDGDDAALFVE